MLAEWKWRTRQWLTEPLTPSRATAMIFRKLFSGISLASWSHRGLDGGAIKKTYADTQWSCFLDELSWILMQHCRAFFFFFLWQEWRAHNNILKSNRTSSTRQFLGSLAAWIACIILHSGRACAKGRLAEPGVNSGMLSLDVSKGMQRRDLWGSISSMLLSWFHTILQLTRRHSPHFNKLKRAISQAVHPAECKISLAYCDKIWGRLRKGQIVAWITHWEP